MLLLQDLTFKLEVDDIRYLGSTLETITTQNPTLQANGGGFVSQKTLVLMETDN